MTLTQCLIEIIRSLCQGIVSVYLPLCLNQETVSLVPICSEAQNANVEADN
jgi:hypothetical protein